GRSEREDVAGARSVTLREAMALAAGRDRVARQYVTDYADVFAVGVAGLADSAAAGISEDWATSRVYMSFLAAFPDSHVARKHGSAVAEEVRQAASSLAARLAAAAAPQRLIPELLAFDAVLKERGINP